jgi:hypothetical protein
MFSQNSQTRKSPMSSQPEMSLEERNAKTIRIGSDKSDLSDTGTIYVYTHARKSQGKLHIDTNTVPGLWNPSPVCGRRQPRQNAHPYTYKAASVKSVLENPNVCLFCKSDLISMIEQRVANIESGEVVEMLERFNSEMQTEEETVMDAIAEEVGASEIAESAKSVISYAADYDMGYISVSNAISDNSSDIKELLTMGLIEKREMRKELTLATHYYSIYTVSAKGYQYLSDINYLNFYFETWASELEAELVTKQN